MDREMYAREKLSAAMEVMATSGAPIQERLLMAYRMLGALDERNFSTAEGKALWIKLRASMTAMKDGDPDLGLVEATMRKIRRVTAEKIADDIWALYEMVTVNHSLATMR